MTKRKRGGAPATTQAGAAPPAPPFHTPFARLADLLGSSTAGARAPEVPATLAAAGRPAGDVGCAPAVPPPRAVVRLERKGRGGKEATVVEKLALTAAEREAWLKQLKHALGCGGVIEGEALVLQGDLRQRVKALLEARGVRKVTLG